MDVDNPSLEGSEKFALEHAHETGKTDQIHPRGLKRRHVSPLGFLIEFGSEFSRWDELRRQFTLAGVFQNASGFHVADHKRNFGGDFTSGYGVRNSDEIRTLARAEHAETECSSWCRHAVNSQPYSTGIRCCSWFS